LKNDEQALYLFFFNRVVGAEKPEIIIRLPTFEVVKQLKVNKQKNIFVCIGDLYGKDHTTTVVSNCFRFWN